MNLNTIEYDKLNKWSNFVTSCVCYVLMPLTPFVFEFAYSVHPRHITERSVVIAFSTYSFSAAFGTKFRVLSVLLIACAFFAGGLYGAVDDKSHAESLSVWAILIYSLILLTTVERYHRHINENEECWFYTIFKPKVN